jgi:hypothetical protein
MAAVGVEVVGRGVRRIEGQTSSSATATGSASSSGKRRGRIIGFILRHSEWVLQREAVIARLAVELLVMTLDIL